MNFKECVDVVTELYDKGDVFSFRVLKNEIEIDLEMFAHPYDRITIRKGFIKKDFDDFMYEIDHKRKINGN